MVCLVYFGVVVANYFVSFWMPEIMKSSITQDPFMIGLVSMIPWGVGAVTMIWFGHHSDKTGERRWHLTGALLASAFFLLLNGIPGLPPVVHVAVLAGAVAGIMSSISTFWAMPASILSGSAAAAGLAWINSVGNLGGYVSPKVVGAIRDHTHNPIYPAVLLAASCLVAAGAVLVATREGKRAGEAAEAAIGEVETPSCSGK